MLAMRGKIYIFFNKSIYLLRIITVWNKNNDENCNAVWDIKDLKELFKKEYLIDLFFKVSKIETIENQQ